jgi:PKD repeat protein
MSRKCFLHLCLTIAVMLAGLAAPLVQPSVAFGAAPPDQPENYLPAKGAVDQSLMPTLVSDNFFDFDYDTHIASQWQVATAANHNTNQDGSYKKTAYDSGTDSSNLVSIDVPLGYLDYSNTYWWHVRYRDSSPEWSEWSDETSFITVAAPQADFTADPNEAGVGQTVYFTDASSGGVAPLSYQWDFGDSSGSTDPSPTHNYSSAGTYSVTLTITDAAGGTNTATKANYITVVAGLHADFSADRTAVVVGQNVTFTNKTSGGGTWVLYEWDFGDGATYSTYSKDVQPTHFYASVGPYTVALTATNLWSRDSDNETKTNYITVSAVLAVDFRADKVVAAVGQTIQFTDLSTGGVTPLTYKWHFNNDTIVDSTAQNPSYSYSSVGTYTVVLTVTDSAANQDTETKTNYVTVITVDITPPVISAVSATGITTTSATIIWTTDEPATGQVEYGLDRTYGSTTALDTSPVTSHGVNLTGLTSETTYHYRVNSADGSGNPAISADYTFTTSDVTGPVISGVTATDVTATGATITWTTNEVATSQIEYGLTEEYGSSTIVDTNLVTSHSVKLTGLKAPKTYHYRVNSADGSGNPAISADYTFTTTDDTSPSKPVVTDDGASTTSLTELHATWTSSDPQSGIVEYQYAIGTTAGGTDVVSWTSVGTNTEVTRTGLTLAWGTAYYFSVKAKNEQGAWSSVGSSNGIQVTDATPPSTPVVTDDGGSTTSTTQLHATWTCNDPESGIEKYQYAIGTTAGGIDVVGWTSVGTSDGVTKTGLKLTVGVTYFFSVRAKNSDGLLSSVGVSDGILVVPPSIGHGTVSAAGGTVQTTDGKITARFPVDAVVGTVTVTIEEIATPSDNSTPEGFTAGNTSFVIKVTDADGKAVVTFSKSIVITLKYSEADVAAGGGDPDNLVLAYWDEAAGEWKALETKVDTTNKTLTLPTTHLSTWAVLARTASAPSGGLPPLVWLLCLVAAVAVVVPIALILARKWFYLKD